MKWIEDNKTWTAHDEEDTYEILSGSRNQRLQFAVFKNRDIWIATTDTLNAAYAAADNESRNPAFFSRKACFSGRNRERQRRREDGRLELKRRTARETHRRLKQPKLYRW